MESLSDTPKIERRYGDCDVTITFKEKAEDIKDKVLWLMLENYKDRISQKAIETISTDTNDNVGQ